MSLVPTSWKVLLGLIVTGVLVCVLSWFVLLFNICSNPRVASAATRYTFPYNCHGATVFITPLERGVLDWDGPVGLVLLALVHVMVAAMLIRVNKGRAI